MKRIFDLLIALFFGTILVLPILFLSCAVLVTSRGPVIYWSDRVGKLNKIFKMPKFRTMKIGAPLVATHLLNNPQQWLTPIGGFVRKTSLDELPQIWCILRGEMSFVGPRPALFNQINLITLRTELGLDVMVPGLTGLAQINGRDELSIEEKVKYDQQYYLNKSFLLDVKILLTTIKRVVSSNGVTH